MTKLALLVGSGDLAATARQEVLKHYSGECVVWSMVEGVQSADDNVDVGNPVELIAKLRGAEIENLCAVGNVDLSPALRANVGKYLVEHYQGKLDMSDIGLETAYRAIAKDARVVAKGIQELVPSLLAGTGNVAGPVVGFKVSGAEGLVRLARTVARTDIGQSVVLHGSRPLAAEDVLGTDNLLDRTRQIAKVLNINLGELILVKVAKPQQSGLGDLPTIGPKTIENCAKAGIGTIVVEGDKCLIANREDLVQLAEQHQVSVIGWG